MTEKCAVACPDFLEERTEQNPGSPSWTVSCRGGGDGGSESGPPPDPGGRGWAAARPSACPREGPGGAG